ncbi:replication initiation protein RepC [Tateyamaria omphalii]|uniref:plasmid replication protein RepC n=1 Tax=Tateyamaria omphalii TaxID=299262 RepID=UPI001C999C86|nr:plasmid replication protein RepC [Tateyamaria omphalii]MBY5935578.1 replication initiation protein RepC [Tateyamaria omphalii]
MTYVPITPFRGTVTEVLLANEHLARTTETRPHADKWDVLRELGVAGPELGVSDRQLTVLQALLSFHPETELGGDGDAPVVFPSNASICERLNGMACSTMRRHLAGLVKAGLIIRRDSPNGKRYTNRSGHAFGFDLSPLALRFPEICAMAEAIRAERDRLKRLRQTVSLMRRDLASLAIYGAETRPELSVWDAFSDLAILTARDLRRRLTEEDMNRLGKRLEEALDKARDLLEPNNLITTDAENEHHNHTSNTKVTGFEPSHGATRKEAKNDEDGKSIHRTSHDNEPAIPLGLILSICAEIQIYTEAPIRHWHDLVRAADMVRPMMGIQSSVWLEAVDTMGPEQAAVTVAAMLERFDQIKSPGGYLRHLARRAGEGKFSCAPMVMALMRKDAA